MDFSSIVFADVARHFGRRRALSGVSLTCDAGEIVALLGANGAGKSTLLSIAATLLSPSAGVVRYGEATAREGGAALRARIGLLGHDLYLYPELTAAENLTLFARLYGVDGAERLAASALDRAGLAGRDGEPIAGFSRGMRQRLALERALIHGPRLVLLDEPFTGLDDQGTAMLAARLRDLGTSGAIVLVATHDLETIERIASRAVMLRGGRLSPLDGAGPLRQRYRAAGGQV
jgi:ABC-type multidrug transport system ATPase subunit